MRPLLFATALALTATPAMADEAAASTCVRTKVWDLYESQWAVRTVSATELEPAKHRSYQMTLYKGIEYKFVACGDESVSNLDVLLYDAEGKVVKRDDSTDREPSFSFTTDATNTFYVVLYNREAKAKSGAAVAVLYK